MDFPASLSVVFTEKATEDAVEPRMADSVANITSCGVSASRRINRTAREGTRLAIISVAGDIACDRISKESSRRASLVISFPLIVGYSLAGERVWFK